MTMARTFGAVAATLIDTRARRESRMSAVNMENTAVLIAGGGPAGLAAATELSRYGVGCLVAEPRPGVSHRRPRAKTSSVRTMEHLRRWGLADAVRAAAPLPVAWSQRVTFCESLSGARITDFDGAFGLTTERDARFAEAGQLLRRIAGDPARGGSAAVPDVTMFTPSAEPGARLPHCWLPDGSSLYAHLGRGFTLLGPAGADDERVEKFTERAGNFECRSRWPRRRRPTRGAMSSCWSGPISTSPGEPRTRSASTWERRRVAPRTPDVPLLF
jgi:hypothetical protein